MSDTMPDSSAADQAVAQQGASAPMPNLPAPTPQMPQQAPAPKPSLWKSVVAGALAGLANSAGSTSFGSGLAKGTAGGLAQQQQEQDNAAQQSAAQLAAQKAADEHQKAVFEVAHTQALNAELIHNARLAAPDAQEQALRDREKFSKDMQLRGGMVPVGQAVPDFHTALDQVTELTQKNPGLIYTPEPQTGPDGKRVWVPMQTTNAPLTQDITVKGPDGKDVTISKGTLANKIQPAVTAAQTASLKKQGLTIQQQNADAHTRSAQASMLKAQSGSNPSALTPDALGFQPKMPVTGAKGYQKISDSFKKNADDLSQTEQSYQQFQDILNSTKNNDLSGAQSVVGLFNAIGISAEPLKGKGFRINNLTVAEHSQARDIREAIEQKAGKFETGEIITRNQLKDYAAIAEQVREQKYVSLVNEAHNQGLNADAFLPTGNGQHIDVPTARIFLKLSGGDKDKARKAAEAKGWKF